jgi:TetR/AcrR family transcriptional regulator, repressor for neighboring sulfatase
MPDPAGTRERTATRREGREVTSARILDAAQLLFAKHGPAAVSIRQVAGEAGVTHALVHKYFGSKEELVKAVAYRADSRRTAMALASPSLKEAYGHLFPRMITEREHSMMLVRSAMEGVEYVDLADRMKTTGALVALAQATRASGATPADPPADIDPRVVVASIAAMFFGWAAIEDWLWPLTGLDPADKDEVYRQLQEIIGYVADLALVGNEGEAAPVDPLATAPTDAKEARRSAGRAPGA